MSDVLGEFSLHPIKLTPLHRKNQYPSRAWETSMWPGQEWVFCPQWWNVKSSWCSSNAMLCSLVSTECPYEGIWFYNDHCIWSQHTFHAKLMLFSNSVSKFFSNTNQQIPNFKQWWQEHWKPLPQISTFPIPHLPPLHLSTGLFFKPSIISTQFLYIGSYL